MHCSAAATPTPRLHVRIVNITKAACGAASFYVYICMCVCVSVLLCVRECVCVFSSFIYTYTVNGVLARSWQHAHRCRFVFGSWQRVDPITVQRVTRIHTHTDIHTNEAWMKARMTGGGCRHYSCVCVLLCWCKHKISADATTHICMMCIIICANYLNKIVILHQQQWLSLRLSDSA